jgi:hypothetical protein
MDVTGFFQQRSYACPNHQMIFGNQDSYHATS